MDEKMLENTDNNDIDNDTDNNDTNDNDMNIKEGSYKKNIKFIIQRKSDGLYVTSRFLNVVCPAFARKFNSERQAQNYMYNCKLKSKQVNICQFDLNDPKFKSTRDKIVAATRKGRLI